MEENEKNSTVDLVKAILRDLIKKYPRLNTFDECAKKYHRLNSELYSSDFIDSTDEENSKLNRLFRVLNNSGISREKIDAIFEECNNIVEQERRINTPRIQDLIIGKGKEAIKIIYNKFPYMDPDEILSLYMLGCSEGLTELKKLIAKRQQEQQEQQGQQGRQEGTER